MGTRSTYRFIQKSKHTDGGSKKTVTKKLALVYFQFDGYPTGHPMDTAKWLAEGKLVNGFGSESGIIFNGAGCLTAQFIHNNKVGTGGVYIEPLDDRGVIGEEYTYDIIVHDDKRIEIIAYEIYWEDSRTVFKKLFQGSPKEFIEKFDKE